MGFTPDNGSLIGTEGVDVLLQVNNNPAGNFIAALGDNDIISLQQTVSPGVLADYTVYGGSGNDRIDLLSSPVDTLIQGEAGNDIININTVGTLGGAIIDSSIRGGAGNDVITLVATGAGATGMVSQGGSGVDAIFASGIFGTSSIRGGADDDTIRFVTDSTIVSSQLNGGQGTDLITNNSGDLLGARRVVTSVLSTISGNAGSDTIDFSLNGTSDLLIFGDSAGGEVSDTALGADGADNIISDAGDDTIFGGGGNDTITSFSGSDSVAGGGGNDFIESGTEDDNVTGDAGLDSILGGLGDDTIDGGTGDDSILGGDDDDLIFGQSGNDTIRGEAGGDTIDGGSGNDILTGGEGDDEIFGDVGNDAIDGGADSDTLIGSFGNDTIAGNTGSDFITNGGGADVVTQNVAGLNAGLSSVPGTAFANATVLSWATTGGMDVVTDFAVDDRLDVELGAAPIITLGNGLSSGDVSAAAVNTNVYFFGTYNASVKTFTVEATGADVLLNGALSAAAFDAGSGTGALIILDNFASQFSSTVLI